MINKGSEREYWRMEVDGQSAGVLVRGKHVLLFAGHTVDLDELEPFVIRVLKALAPRPWDHTLVLVYDGVLSRVDITYSPDDPMIVKEVDYVRLEV